MSQSFPRILVADVQQIQGFQQPETPVDQSFFLQMDLLGGTGLFESPPMEPVVVTDTSFYVHRTLHFRSGS